MRLAAFDFLQVSPIQGIELLPTPILLIHGKEDRYIPPSMSQDLFTAKKFGPKRLYLVPGAKHAEALAVNPAEYERQVKTFLAEISI